MKAKLQTPEETLEHIANLLCREDIEVGVVFNKNQQTAEGLIALSVLGRAVVANREQALILRKELNVFLGED